MEKEARADFYSHLVPRRMKDPLDIVVNEMHAVVETTSLISFS